MKIIINNTQFSYDIGCRLLKLKHNECPMSELEDIWDDIVPMTFKEIAMFKNIEERRIAILCLGLERLISEVKPKLIDKKTIKKTTTWVGNDGELIETKFNDTYELYEVDGEYLNEGLDSKWNKIENSYYVKLKDTSTDRNYFIWIEPRSVYRTNSDSSYGFEIEKINAIQCIAWTIQTNVPVGSIEKIIRQGDCVLIKPKGKYTPLLSERHLTEKEYRKLIVAES